MHFVLAGSQVNKSPKTRQASPPALNLSKEKAFQGYLFELRSNIDKVVRLYGQGITKELTQTIQTVMPADECSLEGLVDKLSQLSYSEANRQVVQQLIHKVAVLRFTHKPAVVVNDAPSVDDILGEDSLDLKPVIESEPEELQQTSFEQEHVPEISPITKRRVSVQPLKPIQKKSPPKRVSGPTPFAIRLSQQAEKRRSSSPEPIVLQVVSQSMQNLVREELAMRTQRRVAGMKREASLTLSKLKQSKSLTPNFFPALSQTQAQQTSLHSSVLRRSSRDSI